MDIKTYTTHRISNDSYAELQSMFLSSFSQKLSLEVIKNKYNTDPFGTKNIGFIARSETGEPAAYYGTFPMRMTYDCSDYLIAQSGDTMTSPNHRKKGLFTRLALETYELCKREDIKLVFGFPNNNSLPGFERKLNWVFTGKMQKLSLKAAKIPLSEISARYSVLKKTYRRHVKRVLSKHKLDLNQLDIDSFNFCKTKGQIKKDLAFFNYKMNQPDVYLIQINGFNLLLKVGRHLYIGEVGKIAHHQVDDLLKTILLLAKKMFCGRVVISLSKNHWLHELLKDKVVFSESLPIGFYQIDELIDISNIQFSQADYDTF